MNERLLTGDYQAVLSGWSVGLMPELATLWAPDSPFNYTRYGSAEFARLMSEALAQPTYEAAVPFWQSAASRLAQDQPYTWLYYMDMVDGVNQRVRGARIDTYGAFQNVWEWWIPAAERRPGETLE